MENWKTVKKELLRDPKVKREYKKLKPRYELISQIIEARRKSGLTQAALAKKLNTKQSAVARVESGKANISVDFLGKIASAMGSKLIIQIQ